MPGRLSALPECLVLAALLHMLLVAVLGSAPGGSARPGEGVWGALNIRLAGTAPARSAAEQPPLPEAYSGPPGQAAERRWGGTVRDNATPETTEPPGAARLGTWNPARTAADADPLPPALAQPTRPATDVAPPSAAPAPAPAPLSTPLPAAAPAPPGQPRPSGSPSGGPAEITFPALPLAPVLPVPPVVPVPPAATVARSVPAAPAVPTVLPPAPDAAPAVPLAAPDGLPPVASEVRELRDVPPLRALRELEPLPSVPAPLAKAEVSTAAVPAFVPLPPAAEPAPARALAVPPALGAATPLPLSTPLALPSVPAAAAAPPLQEIPLAPSPRGTRSARPAEATAAAPLADERPLPARPAMGAPDAGAARGHDVATAPAAPASAPRLNLDLVRPRGGEISREGSRGVLNLLPHPPEMKKLADDIQKSARPDCRNAYSSLGLLGAVPLAADALRKEGCRW